MTEDIQLLRDVPRIKLYLCMLYPGGASTLEMDTTYKKLKRISNLDLHTIVIEGGTFSHRHPRDKPDEEQCRLRNIYLDKVPGGEWLLVMDSDEELFGALENLPQLLHMATHNNMNYIMISEMLPNGTLLLRPRLIFKREGLKYGGPSMKHDWISYRDHIACLDGIPNPIHVCKEINYIDIADEDNSMIADFLGFWHYKNGVGLSLYSKERVLEMPPNIVRAVEGRLVRETDFKYTCQLCGETFDFKKDLDKHQEREEELVEIRGGTL